MSLDLSEVSIFFNIFQNMSGATFQVRWDPGSESTNLWRMTGVRDLSTAGGAPAVPLKVGQGAPWGCPQRSPETQWHVWASCQPAGPP